MKNKEFFKYYIKLVKISILSLIIGNLFFSILNFLYILPEINSILSFVLIFILNVYFLNYFNVYEKQKLNNYLNFLLLSLICRSLEWLLFIQFLKINLFHNQINFLIVLIISMIFRFTGQYLIYIKSEKKKS